MSSTTPSAWPTVRDLPLVARVVLGIYLVSFGFGYISALVQMHFQEASPGEILPTYDDVLDHYSGGKTKGQFERLITAHELKPFNASGTMRPAFTYRSGGWKGAIRKWAKENNISETEAEKELRERNLLQADALVAWIHGGYTKETYENGFTFKAKSKEAKSFDKWLAEEDKRVRARGGMQVTFPDEIEFDGNDTWTANIKAIIDSRCARCHEPNAGGAAGKIHLDEYDSVVSYITPVEDPASRGVSLRHLAQSTHAHLLSFTMLYTISGFFFAFTSYPLWVRFVIAPLPLFAQLFEIACWWLARMEPPYGPTFAFGIMVLGGIVGLGILLQITLGLFDLFGAVGRVVLLGLVVVVLALGVVFVKPIVERQLSIERTMPTLHGIEEPAGP